MKELRDQQLPSVPRRTGVLQSANLMGVAQTKNGPICRTPSSMNKGTNLSDKDRPNYCTSETFPFKNVTFISL